MHDRYEDLHVEELDLFSEDLPAALGENIESKYTLMAGKPVDEDHKESWEKVERLIEHFLSADLYLISVPMWNFSIPYALKFYIDSIIQPGYLFTYNEQGQAVGLVNGKKMVCVSSRGGDYSANSPFHSYDFQEPYLRSIFGFVGITDIHFIHAQPTDINHELREKVVSAAIEEAHRLASNYEWEVNPAIPHVQNPANLKPKTL